MQHKVAVLGASGLIGQAICTGLMLDGFQVVAVARRFIPAQVHTFAVREECPIVGMDPAALAALWSRHRVDIVVNCIGILQDAGTDKVDTIHSDFVQRLLGSLEGRLLVHISIPGQEAQDATPYAQSKRAGEKAIAASGNPFVVIRPGFVVAPGANGGGAMLRALGALPLRLPEPERGTRFAATDVGDIVRTVEVVVRRWRDGERDWRETWDVMEKSPGTVGDVVEAFRRHLGGPKPVVPMASWMMAIGSLAGDLASRLGWLPPIRSTAIRELRRGARGHPEVWSAATGIEPNSLGDTLFRMGSTVQDRWFARLYLLKAAVLGSLALFWILSGLVALTVGFSAAAAMLNWIGVPAGWAAPATIAGGLVDLGVGVAICLRRTVAAGLVAGVVVTVFYLGVSVVLAPALWIDPLGEMVKTIPVLVLMLVALAIRDAR